MKVPYRQLRRRKKQWTCDWLSARSILALVVFVQMVRSLLVPCNRNKGDGHADGQIGDFSRQPRATSLSKPFYELDKTRFLILRPSQNGLNNQLQCLNVAANLAIEYNRTLLLKINAYVGSEHGSEPISFSELFDVPNVRLSVQLVKDLPSTTATVTAFDPEIVSTSELLIDPHPDAKYLSFRCSYGDLYHSLPSSASHRHEVLLPFNPIYRTLAQRVIDTMQKQSSHKARNFQTLGIHVRRGDLKGYPAFVCSKTGYPRLSSFKENGWWLAACTTEHGGFDKLSWDRVFLQLQNGNDPGVPLHSRDYDAIFVATNDFPYVSQWQIPNLFAIHDFSFVRETLCRKQCHDIKEFIVEEMVLVLCTFFQPSAPSSITDMILHHRLEEHGRNEHDVDIYEAYNQLLFELKKQRKGVILNLDAMFESLKASQRAHES
jgi:GDP-fucose protein O-fucosyltransferase